jgi:hypothetical protein
MKTLAGVNESFDYWVASSHSQKEITSETASAFPTAAQKDLVSVAES